MLERTKKPRVFLGALAIVVMASVAGATVGDPSALNAQEMFFDDDGRAWYSPCPQCHRIAIGGAGQSICAYAPGDPKCKTVTYTICTGASGGFQVVTGSLKGCIEFQEIWYWT
jgi:hypothetical protein